MTGTSIACADDDNDSSIPTCRICQSTIIECPDMPLIRPCLCRGSLAFVHVDCLNQWRSTSAYALAMCSVCNFKYKTKPKPAYSNIVSHHYFFLAASFLITLTSVLILGFVFSNIPTFSGIQKGKNSSFSDMPRLLRNWIGIKPLYSCYDGLYNHITSQSNESFELSYEYIFKLWYSSICKPINRRIMDIMLVGHVVVSIAASVFITLPRLWAGRRDHLDQNQLIYIFFIIATLSQSAEYTVTAICWHGLATFVRHVYSSIETLVRSHLSGLEEVIGDSC